MIAWAKISVAFCVIREFDELHEKCFENEVFAKVSTLSAQNQSSDLFLPLHARTLMPP